MSITTEQLEAMLAAATPGPWICYADIPSADPNWHIVTTANKLRVLANVHIEPGNSVDPANSALIAAAPTITSELIAAHKRIAELEALRKPAIYSAAVIGSFYEWVERVEKAGGPTCISGIAECNAMIKSLRKNAKRADELVMKPLREAIAALEAKP